VDISKGIVVIKEKKIMRNEVV